MKKLLVVLFTCMIAMVGFALPRTTYADTTDSSINTFNPLELNYVNLDGVTDFDIAGDNIYLANNSGISVYNTTAHTLTDVATLSGIQHLYSYNSYLFAVTADAVNIIDSSGNTSTLSIDAFQNIDISASTDTYVVAYTTGSEIVVNTYTYPNTLVSTATHALTGDYFVSISESNVYLLNKSANEWLQYEYASDTMTTLDNAALNITSRDALYTTQTHLVVVMQDSIRLIDKETYDVTNYTKLRSNPKRAWIQGEIDTPSSIKYRNNKLYVLDSVNKNIQTLVYGDGEITCDQVVLASFGADQGRLYNARSLALKNDNQVFVSDYGNNRIQVLNADGQIDVIDNISAPKVILDEYNNMFAYTLNTDTTTLYRYTIQGLVLGSTHTYNGIISDMCIDNQNTIYILDYNSNTINSSNALGETWQFTEYVNLSEHGITADANSKIYYVNSLGDIVVSVADTLYLVNANKSVALGANIISMEIDFNQNVYALLNNGTIVKYNFDTAQKQILSGFDNIATFTLNQVNGKLYMYDNVLSNISVLHNSDFSNGITDFEHYDTTISSNTGKDYIFNWATIDGYIFEYPNYLGMVYNTTGDVDKVILIQSPLPDEPFCYVMFTENGINHLGYAKRTDLTINEQPIATTNTQFVAKEKSVKIYKYPTLLNNVTIGTYNQNQVINSCATYPVSIDGYNYHVVHTDNGYGYVYDGDIITYSAKFNREIDSDNATIKIHDHTTGVAVYDDNKGTTQIAVLADNKRVFVEKYDKNSEYTFVKYLDQTGSEQSGYVLTKYVKYDSNNTLLITGIVVFVGAVILGTVIAVSYARYRKREHAE